MSDDFAAWIARLDLWSFISAALSILVGLVAARLTRRWVTRALNRLRGSSNAARRLVAKIAYYAVLLLGVGVAFSFLGAPTLPLLLAVVVVSVVAVISLRGVAENFASGIVLQLRHTVDIGDIVASGDHVGAVIDMNGRAVVLRTAQGVTIHLPNSAVRQNPLTNYSTAVTNRDEIEIRLQIGDRDRAAVRATIEAAVAAAPGVAPDRPVEVLVVLTSPSRTTLRVRFWSSPKDPLVVSSAVVDAVTERLTREGCEAVVTSAVPPPAPAPMVS